MFNVFFCSIFTRNKMLNKFINVVIIKDGRSIIEKIATKNNPAPSPFPDEVISMWTIINAKMIIIAPDIKLSNFKIKCFLIIDILFDSIC